MVGYRKEISGPSGQGSCQLSLSSRPWSRPQRSRRLEDRPWSVSFGSQLSLPSRPWSRPQRRRRLEDWPWSVIFPQLEKRVTGHELDFSGGCKVHATSLGAIVSTRAAGEYHLYSQPIVIPRITTVDPGGRSSECKPTLVSTAKYAYLVGDTSYLLAT